MKIIKCFVLLLVSLLVNQFVHAQNQPTVISAAEIAKLDQKETIETGEIIGIEELGTEGGLGGSGDGEEPPGYDGDWWYDLQGLRKANHFHTGDDLGEYAENIVKLTISSMNGGAIPKAVGDLRNLRVLEIDFAAEHPLPSGIWSLPKLEVLILRPWGSCSISPEIGNLEMLQQLVIIGGAEQTVRIPAEIGQLKSLERLVISGCKAPTEGLDVSRMRNLVCLSLQEMGLTTFPKGYGNLNRLDSLVLTGNSITTIPSTLEGLEMLRTLDLANNQLTTLPPSIKSLKSLYFLILANNRLTTLPQEIEGLTDLGELDLKSNHLGTLPTEIGNIKSLRFLNIDKNQLSTLPESIGQLDGLLYLDLDKNQLTTLPSTLGEMAGLNALNLTGNRLTTLPSSIGKLTDLSDLRLTGNPLTSLPSEIMQLTKLRDFTLDKAGLLDLPREIWEFVNRRGVKFKNVPTEIAGKPLAFYLAHPQIDAYSKRYIQGDLAIEPYRKEDLRAMDDSLLTRNPETAPFYLYLFAYGGTPPTGTGRMRGYISLLEVKDLAAAYIMASPCSFFAEVKNGPYKGLYTAWLMVSCDILTKKHPKYSDLFLALRAKMKPVCGNQYEADLYQMVKDLRKFL